MPKHSSGVLGASTTRGKSPWPPYTSKFISLCSGLVGMPVLGPLRWESTMTSGISAIPSWPIPSCIRDNPGPEVATIALVPVNAAPIAIFTTDSSSSTCRTIPPNLGNHFSSHSMMSVEGVMGYPAKNRPPATIKPNATASLPVMSIWGCGSAPTIS